MWSTPHFKCGASIWRHNKASKAAGQEYQELTRKQACVRARLQSSMAPARRTALVTSCAAGRPPPVLR